MSASLLPRPLSDAENATKQGTWQFHCRWLAGDETTAPEASIVRLVVDDRWAARRRLPGYLPSAFRAVLTVLPPGDAVLATPAGAVVADVTPRDPSLGDMPAVFGRLERSLSRFGVPTAEREILLGVDATAPGEEVAGIQAVAIWASDTALSWQNTVLKFNPTRDELGSLVGWHICAQEGRIPPELAIARRLRTAAGVVLVLVCNDAVAFTNRARRHRALTRLRRLVAAHLHEQAERQPRPDHVLIATHAQNHTERGGDSGRAFLAAAADLAARTGATVTTTTFAPHGRLDHFAARFGVLGPQADRVATLLVEDVTE